MAVFETYLGKNDYDEKQYDRFFVADYLLPPEPMQELRQYDLSGFDGEITDVEIAKQLDGLNTHSILIARSFERHSRLNAFHDLYVEPDEIVHQTPQGEQMTFSGTEVSLIGHDGSMIHIRRGASQSEDAGCPMPMLAVISHIDDPNPATLRLAVRANPQLADGSKSHIYTVGTVEDANLQLVERPMNETEWGVEKVLLGNAAHDALPMVKIQGDDMWYRRSDGHWEVCSDLEVMHRRASIALSRQLGYASMPQIAQGEIAQTGQFEQKVLG